MGSRRSEARDARGSRASVARGSAARTDLVLYPHLSLLMSSVSRLRAILSSAFSSRGLPNGEQEFFEELMAHKPQLVSLYDVGPRNPQEQRELEAGAFAYVTVYERCTDLSLQGRSPSTVAPSR